MNKIALAFITAAALVAGTPLLTTPAHAQVDVQIGGDHRDHDRDRDHRGPHFGVVVGEHARCHTVTITERHEGRVVTRTERRCD